MKNPRKMDMHSFLLKLLLPIYVLISLSMVISHAKAVEHPRPRFSRSRDHHNKPPIHVSVKPKEIDLYPGAVITIACKAKGGNRIEETPFISFYRELEAGHIPLSSGDPGVLIEPVIVSDNNNEQKAKKLLTLGKFAWYTLEWGDNMFYCKAQDMDGHSGKSYFKVIKKWHDNYHNLQRRKRRYLLLKLRRQSHAHEHTGHKPAQTSQN